MSAPKNQSDAMANAHAAKDWFEANGVFVSGALWGINSFDQWGVELGKALCADLMPRLADGGRLEGLDGSTAGLVNLLRSA
jgi:glucose-6-phosphate isomerase